MHRAANHLLSRALMAVAVGLALAAPASAIVLYPDDTTPAANLPSDLTVGSWYKNPTTGNGSVVAIDPNYIITVRHTLGGVADGSLVMIGTATYSVAQEFDCGSADLRICRITNLDGTPANLSTYASIYIPTNEAASGLTFAMGGYGQGRGAPVLSSSGATVGYYWDGSGNTTLRWGANKVEGTGTSTGTYTSNILLANFDPEGSSAAVPHEAAIGLYDSGGGWFVDVSPDGSGDWRLIGVTEGTQNGGESLFTPPDYFYAVRTSSYASWILTTLGRSMWSNVLGGTWSTAGNWVNGAPNGQGAYAMLSDNLVANTSITLNSPVTLGTLWIEGAYKYTINGTGSGSLTFDASSGTALLNVSGTSAQTIAAPVTLNVALMVDQRSSGDLTFSKGLSGSVAITKTGAGTMVLSSSSNGGFSGGFNVAQGLLRVTASGGLGTGAVTLSGGSLGWRAGSSMTYANTVSATADAAILADATSHGSGLTVTLGQLAVTGDHTITVASTSGCAVQFSGQSSLAGLTTGATINTASGDLKLTGGLTFSTGSLTKTGSGALTLAGVQSYGTPSAAASLNALAGTVNLNSDAGPAAAPYRLAVSVSGSGALMVNATQHLAALNLSDSATAAIGAGGTTVLMTNGLTLGPAAKLDVANNALVVNYSGASPLAAIQTLIRAAEGTNSGGVFQWDGTSGITSSAARAGGGYTGLGVWDLGVPLTGRMVPTSIEGVPVSPSSVVVKYTWLGDMNLDGKVTVDDYAMFLYDFVNQGGLPMEWATGDFNGDGKIDVNDYAMFLAGYTNQSGALSAGEQITSAEMAAGFDMLTPEPATLALLALGGMAALARRRRAGRLTTS